MPNSDTYSRYLDLFHVPYLCYPCGKHVESPGLQQPSASLQSWKRRFQFREANSSHRLKLAHAGLIRNVSFPEEGLVCWNKWKKRDVPSRPVCGSFRREIRVPSKRREEDSGLLEQGDYVATDPPGHGQNRESGSLSSVAALVIYFGNGGGGSLGKGVVKLGKIENNKGS